MSKYARELESAKKELSQREGNKKVVIPKGFSDEGEISLEGFLSQKFTPSEFIWEGLMETKSLNMIVGDSGLGKSRVSEELGYCIATGDSFLGRATKQGRVLLIDAEHTDFKLQERMLSIVERRPSEAAHLTILSRSQCRRVLQDRLNLFDGSHRAWMDKKVERHDFIIIDTYSSCAPLDTVGGYDGEHEAWKDLENWMVDWTDHGKTFLMTHHTNRDGKARGTSLIDVNMSTILSLQRTKDIPYRATLAAELSVQKGRDIPLEDQVKKVLAFFKDRSEWKSLSTEWRGWLLRNIQEK